MTGDVTWEARWEHSECGTYGEALLFGAHAPESGHYDCPESGTVGWTGRGNASAAPAATATGRTATPPAPATSAMTRMR